MNLKNLLLLRAIFGSEKSRILALRHSSLSLTSTVLDFNIKINCSQFPVFQNLLEQLYDCLIHSQQQRTFSNCLIG